MFARIADLAAKVEGKKYSKLSYDSFSDFTGLA